MRTSLTRRNFLKQSSLLTTALAVAGPARPLRAARSPGEKVLIGVIGCNNRGLNHITGFLSAPNTEIAYVCDVDSRAAEKGVAAAAKRQQRKPQAAKDFRTMLEDPNLDAVSIATPDHWHAPAAILACAASKHVYVEKPGSHNLHESELILAAARKYKRLVQMGNQRRSWPWVIEAISALRAGELGRVCFARAWYTAHRPSIGHGKPAPIPDWLDYSLWQGPAPERPFRDNILPYHWHWYWNWGTGELGNNGVHGLDLARWGLTVDCPQRVTCGGNRYHFKDDQETPDTCVATFDFGDKGIVWEGQSCDPRGFEGVGFGVNFYGETGSMSIAGDNCKIYDLNQKVVREIAGRYNDTLHFANFIEAIRSGDKLNSEIEDGQKSTVLCHLGNIAWRAGRTVNFDPQTRRIVGDKSAAEFCKRAYRKGWEPKI